MSGYLSFSLLLFKFSTMKRILYIILGVFFCLTSLVNCAKRGTIQGGARDSLPPVLLKATPENYSTNFSEKEIVLKFDEYVKLEKLNDQLIISPPMETMPEFSPMGFAKKEVVIKLIDTLRPHTTYTINMGKSIVDNNEGNSYEAFKYVFSTGDYIDSLKLKVQVEDLMLKNASEHTQVALYSAEDFYDSIVEKKKPYYVGTVANGTAVLENLRAGNYYLFAFEDVNKNNKIELKTEKMSFASQKISIPTDSIFRLKLFQHSPQKTYKKPIRLEEKKWVLGYKDSPENIQKLSLEVSDFKQSIKSRFYKDPTKDSLFVFIKEPVADSLLFKIKYPEFEEKIISVFSPNNKPSKLIVAPSHHNKIGMGETLSFQLNIPIEQFDPTAFVLERVWMEKSDEKEVEQSEKIAFNITLDSLHNTLIFHFEKKPKSSYKVQLFPKAITDYFEQTNDSLKLTLNTDATEDYSTLELTINEGNIHPMIVELINNKHKVTHYKTLKTNEQTLTFSFVQPATYYIRITKDANQNNRWDAGNYYQKIQPEEVYHHPKSIDARANWEIKETVTLPTHFSK